jgi:hypothetical protein
MFMTPQGERLPDFGSGLNSARRVKLLCDFPQIPGLAVSYDRQKLHPIWAMAQNCSLP